MARSVSSHARKFFLAYLALAALFGSAVGLFVVLVERPGPKPKAPWSLWQPTGTSASARQAQIANHIAARYHLPTGARLVDVLPSAPGTTSDPIRAVAISSTLTPTQRSDILSFIDASKTAMYIMCGDGPKCSIKEGKATTARAAVLRREALELALYTLEYVPAANSVVTFFPPKKGQSPTYALFFVKPDFKTQLNQPLRKTLPAPQPPLPGQITPVEKAAINSLTTPRVFRYSLQHEQNGARVLVLAPATG